MKRTTYWTLGAFVATFLFTVSVIIYVKYKGDEQNMPAPQLVTIKMENIHVVKVLGRGKEEPQSSCFRLLLKPTDTDNGGSLKYPDKLIKATQKGDTLLLAVEENENKQALLRNSDTTVELTVPRHIGNIDFVLNFRVYEMKLHDINLKECHIKGNSGAIINAEQCTIDKLEVTTGYSVNLPGSKITTMSLRIDDMKLDDAATASYRIQNLYLTGKNDDYDAFVMNSKNIRHVYLKPTKGHSIYFASSSDAEIVFPR